jgi:hypothetical protein
MSTLPKADTRAHRVISEMRPAMAKADLRKAENVEKPADIGGCLDFARNYVGWNLDQLAAALKRDPRQVRRWIANEENIQLGVVWKVKALQRAVCDRTGEADAGLRDRHGRESEDRMSETKHTPGPWVAEWNPHNADIMAPGAGTRIAVVCAPGMGARAEDAANARLIAKAPALLAVVRMLDQAVQRGEPCCVCNTSPHIPNCAVTLALAGAPAAAKAEGRS